MATPPPRNPAIAPASLRKATDIMSVMAFCILATLYRFVFFSQENIPTFTSMCTHFFHVGGFKVHSDVPHAFASLPSVPVTPQFLKRRSGQTTNLEYCNALSTCTESRDGRCDGHVPLQFIQECNRQCQCTLDCPNRVVQRGLKTSLEVTDL